MNKETNPRHVYRPVPCPAYDVEGMEKWLSDQAEKGLFLTKDGFFINFASFERGEPRRAKYRLEAAQKSTSMWADNGGEPDPEQIELSEKYAWEYIAKRGDFYIYRSFDPEARELNTDPAVQALALNAVKKRQRGSIINLVIWTVIYPLIFLRGGILLTIIHMKTWLFLLTAILVLWMIADGVTAFLSLHKLQKKLRKDGSLQADKDWRKGIIPYYAKQTAELILAIVLICICFSRWSDSVMDTDKMQLDKYTGSLPFAAMSDFADADITNYRMTMTGLNFNTIKQWSDFLAPQCIEYNENAEITLSDGTVLNGGYGVDYYETRHPAIAGRLAREMYHIDSGEKNFEPMETPDLDADYDMIYTYWNIVHFPVVIIQNGNRVLRAYFHQSYDCTVPFEQWASILAQSIDIK